MRFCEASAKDNFNVDEIFLKLVDDILKKVKRVYILKVYHLKPVVSFITFFIENIVFRNQGVYIMKGYHLKPVVSFVTFLLRLLYLETKVQ